MSPEIPTPPLGRSSQAVSEEDRRKKGKEEFEEGKEVECKKKIKLKSSLLTNSFFSPSLPSLGAGCEFLICIVFRVK